MSTTIIIPARYQSSRYPGKPLVKVLGKTMIERVFRIGKAVKGVADVYVATDDARIAEAARGFGAPVIMTSSDCRNGTERVAEAVAKLQAKPDLVINLQGDAPLTPPAFIEALILVMSQERSEVMGTPAVRCTSEALERFRADRRAGRVGGTTVVCNKRGHALYFSKEVIPYMPQGRAPRLVPVFHHVGLYAFRPEALKRYAAWEMGPLEQLEQLEQLRFLEQGVPVRVVEVEAGDAPFWEINNPQDVARVEEALRKYGDPTGR